jgi:hypothetical protein
LPSIHNACVRRLISDIRYGSRWREFSQRERRRLLTPSGHQPGRNPTPQ